MFRYIIAVIFVLITTHTALAGMQQRLGWVVIPTSHDYATLAKRVKTAAAKQKLGVVSQASATAGAKKVLNKTIPGNTVIGLYHPRFAVPMLEASIAAGIEAPIRIYVTENADKTATLSYKKPSHVFSPYMDEGGAKLKTLATELDLVFDTLATEAAAN
jgi:uncharacterized protein (DUF302 family)